MTGDNPASEPAVVSNTTETSAVKAATPAPRRVSLRTARAMMIVNAAVWGSGYTMIKHVQAVMPSQWLMFFRMASAAVLMAIVFWPHLRKLGLRRYIVPGLLLSLSYWLGFIFQLKGLETTAPGRNSFLTDTYCVMVPFVVWAFTRRRPTLRQVLAAFACLLGIGLVSLGGSGGAGLGGGFTVGDALTVAGALCYAVNLVHVGMVGRRFDAIGLMLMEFFWCAVLFGAGALIFDGAPHASWFTWDVAGCIAYLVVGSTIIGQVFQTIAVQVLPTAQASVLLSTECIFAMIVSVLVTHEQLTVFSLLGFVVIFGAIVLSQTTGRRNKGNGDAAGTAA